MPKLNTHQILVETEADEVNVVIADHGGVAGGFAKFFNRVIDSGVWADLSDAARAAYMPLVRFADHRNHFRVRIGQAGLMKHSGLSRSSVKRAMKDLIARRLIVVVGQGGVTVDGQNESNVYQLLVPGKAKSPASDGAAAEPTPSPTADPLPGRSRTPSPARREPPGRPSTDRVADHRWTPGPSNEPAPPGAGAGPSFRSNVQEFNNKSGPDDISPGVVSLEQAAPPPAAALLLMEHGVAPEASRDLAGRFPYERIVDVVATMEYRRARGKCDNPGGFLRDALVKQWQVPRAVLDARVRAAERLRAEAGQQRARDAEAAGDAKAREEERRAERRLQMLDDDEIELLAAEVLRKYDGNPAVLQVLTRRPPRECRLMKMEINALLDAPRERTG